MSVTSTTVWGVETTFVVLGPHRTHSYPAAVRRLLRPLLESAPDDLPTPPGRTVPQMLRTATIAVLGLRVAYGVALIAAPERLALRWLGPAAGTPPAQVPLRGLGAREIVVHGAAIAAATRDLPLRPFLAASVAGDLADLRPPRSPPPAWRATWPTSPPPWPGAVGCPTAPRPRRSPSPEARRC